MPGKKAATKRGGVITVQLPYETGTGAPEDAAPAAVEELSELHWVLVEKIREANPGMRHDLVHRAALDATMKTMEETVAMGLALPLTAGVQEQYEQRVWRHIEWRQR